MAFEDNSPEHGWASVALGALVSCSLWTLWKVWETDKDKRKDELGHGR